MHVHSMKEQVGCEGMLALERRMAAKNVEDKMKLSDLLTIVKSEY